jgi:hypothetical protein
MKPRIFKHATQPRWILSMYAPNGHGPFFTYFKTWRGACEWLFTWLKAREAQFAGSVQA